MRSRSVLVAFLRALVACWMLLAVACGQQNETGVPSATVPPSDTTAAVSVTTTSAASVTTAPMTSTTTSAAPATTSTSTTQTTVTPGPGEFQNPVIRSDFPDPGIINVDGTYYAYATNGTGKNIQTAKSTDLVNWTMLPDTLPALPKWAMFTSGFVWAPEVIQIGDTFAMYYTARSREFDQQCVGVATSDRPDGRFTDTRTEPLVCQSTEGGTIDANPFRDGDKLYLYFKNDGNCCGKTTYIYGQELSADGLTLVGEPVRLIKNDKGWEGRVVEAPTMWKEADRYYMFYSANNYGDLSYAVGYATCEGPLGPCEDAPENPILKSTFGHIPAIIGPGHQTIVVDDDGEQWITYHHWEMLRGGIQGERRFLSIDRLLWEDGKPIIDGPTQDPQPVP
jgi:beta-xylosidase